MRIKWYRKAAALILAAAMMVPCGMQAMAAEKDLEAVSKKESGCLRLDHHTGNKYRLSGMPVNE